MDENNPAGKDKFKAVWLSHSSISDFLKCPRLYYLRNVYKDPKTGHKITVMSPPLALGQIVHEVVEGLSILPVSERFNISLSKKFETSWPKVAGEKGGFKNKEQELEYKERGIQMLSNLEKSPGPLLNKALKIRMDGGLPYYWFSESENIILCGKIDWIEYLPDTDSIHIIDFKTGRRDEEDSSLQLPIYLLLATNTQKRKIEKASYWYLDRENGLKEVTLPTVEESIDRVGQIASRIKLARQLDHFVCKTGGCRHCRDLERVFRGEGKRVGVSEYNQDIYFLD
jgi:CRISPR/Cas system-associated exonuclease Cas4 (RecB family)